MGKEQPANRLLEFRVERDWSQERLARKARLHWSAVSRIERGERNPGPRTRKKLAEALGVPEEVLFPQQPEEAAV